MTRRSLSLLTALLCFLVVSNISGVHVATATSPPPSTASPTATATSTSTPSLFTPSDPTQLSMSLPGSKHPLPPGAWTSSQQLNLTFRVQVDGSAVTPEVEFAPVSTPFRDRPNATGASLSASGIALVRVHGLAGKEYRWQARVIDSNGNSSAWVPFSNPRSQRFDFAVDRTPPLRPIIASATDPNPNIWYNNRAVHFNWSSQDYQSGIQGYSFVLEHQAHVIPPGTIEAHPYLSISSLADGVWFLAVRSVDRAGNWSPTATFRVQLDRSVPQLTWLSPRRFTFNPYQGPTTVQFRANKDVSVRLNLYRVGERVPTSSYTFAHVRADAVESLTWTGKDQHGKPLKAGYYFFSTQAVDHADNVLRVNMGGIDLKPERPHVVVGGEELFPDGGKRIIVSLSRETLYAYTGDHLDIQTYVTTGNPSLPTPTGHYSVMQKFHPFEFISPWPLGSPYYYAPSWTTYAMLFRDGGYFLHDAPWRSAFGPGTNGPGQPGTNYGGTHGCVNIPPGPMLALWNWTPVGTPVDVVQ